MYIKTFDRDSSANENKMMAIVCNFKFQMAAVLWLLKLSKIDANIKEPTNPIKINDSPIFPASD